jgi:hypothetical protein
VSVAVLRGAVAAVLAAAGVYFLYTAKPDIGIADQRF